MRCTNNGQRALVESGRSFRELARLAGVSTPVIMRWKRGEAIPQRREREALLDALGIDVEAWELDDGVDAVIPETNRGGRPKAVTNKPAPQPMPPRRADPIPRTVRAASPTPRAASSSLDVEPEDFPRYPSPPPTDAPSIAAARHALACIRHDLTHRRDLSLPSLSKLRGDEARALALVAKLEREGELTEARFVKDHPAFREHCARILEALRPYPDASRAVVAALTA